MGSTNPQRLRTIQAEPVNLPALVSQEEPSRDLRIHELESRVLDLENLITWEAQPLRVRAGSDRLLHRDCLLCKAARARTAPRLHAEFFLVAEQVETARKPPEAS